MTIKEWLNTRKGDNPSNKQALVVFFVVTAVGCVIALIQTVRWFK